MTFLSDFYISQLIWSKKPVNQNFSHLGHREVHPPLQIAYFGGGIHQPVKTKFPFCGIINNQASILTSQSHNKKEIEKKKNKTKQLEQGC